MFSITATDLHRFMNCNGSMFMETFQSSIERDKSDRAEGDAAHWLVQQVHSGKFSLEELVDRPAPNGVFITSQMIENVERYIADITSKEVVEITGKGMTEIDTSYTDGVNVWQVNGRADYAVFDNGEIIIKDFKYGWGIVEPEDNWTLISHAIGYVIHLNKTVNFNLMHMASAIKLQIYQPRPYHPRGKFREWVITPQQLMDFYKQIGEALTRPSKELRTGDHCKNCPAMVHCPAFIKAQSNALEATDKAYSDNISDADLSIVLDSLARAGKIIEQAHDSYKELALHRLKEGRVVNNYIAQSELTNRVWKDFINPEMLGMMTGVKVTKEELLTPSQIEKLGVPKDVVDSFSERRSKGFKLVRMDANKAAKKFNNLNKI